jgi:hypothetical protein
VVPGESIAGMEENPERIRVSDRIFRYFENSLMQVVLGIFGGLSGLFLDGRWYVFLTPLAVAALRRGRVLEGLHRQIQIVAYIIATCVIAAMFFFCGIKMNKARDKQYGALIQVIRSVPSPSISTEQWFWPRQPSRSGLHAVAPTPQPPPQDELLDEAVGAESYCKEFLNAYGGSPIFRDFRANIGEQREQLGECYGQPEPQKDRCIKAHKDGIQGLQSRISNKEMSEWDKAYGEEFQHTITKMSVVAAGRGNMPVDIGKPSSVDDLDKQCTRLLPALIDQRKHHYY